MIDYVGIYNLIKYSLSALEFSISHLERVLVNLCCTCNTFLGDLFIEEMRKGCNALSFFVCLRMIAEVCKHQL